MVIFYVPRICTYKLPQGGPMSRLKPTERTERRVQMFIDRGIFKQKTDVLDAAVELLVRHQMEVDSRKQAEEFKPDSAVLFAQEATIKRAK